MNKKKRAFRNEEIKEQRRVQKELKVKLKESREAYGKKLACRSLTAKLKDSWRV